MSGQIFKIFVNKNKIIIQIKAIFNSLNPKNVQRFSTNCAIPTWRYFNKAIGKSKYF